MRKSISFSLILICISSACFAGEYSLLMNKNDCLCKHMLRLYNADIKQYGEVKHNNHEEFNWLKWKEIVINSRYAPEDSKIAFFDINNDSRNEAIVWFIGYLNNSPTDGYEVFGHGVISELDKTIDDQIWSDKSLKDFASWEGHPVKISDIDQEVVRKLPKELRQIVREKIIAVENRGDKKTYFEEGGNKINFLRFKDRFFLTFEERTNAETLALALDRFYGEGGDPKTSRRGTSWLEEGFTRPANYTLISEYQKDNTLKHQCLYIREDRPAFKGAPSFDCKKVKSEVEKMICNDDDLAWSDKILNEEYQKALKRTDSKKQIIKSQRQWLKHVRNACRNVECLKKAYETRIKELGSL